MKRVDERFLAGIGMRWDGVGGGEAVVRPGKSVRRWNKNRGVQRGSGTPSVTD